MMLNIKIQLWLTGSLWFYLNDEATNFNVNIANNNNFKYFQYKAKLLGNTETDEVNGIIRSTKNAVSLKYLSNFCGSLGMSNPQMIMMMLIAMMLYSLNNTQNYMSLQSLYQQKKLRTIKTSQ